MSANFFQTLRLKIEKAPDRHFDPVFWAKFEGEFGAAAAPVPFWWRVRAILDLRALIPLAAALLVAVVYVAVNPRDPAPGSETHLASEIISRGEMYGEIELFDSLEPVELADADWALLLDGEELDEG